MWFMRLLSLVVVVAAAAVVVVVAAAAVVVVVVVVVLLLLVCVFCFICFADLLQIAATHHGGVRLLDAERHAVPVSF